MKKIVFFFSIIVSGLMLHAQTGVIKGTIVDATTKEALIGAAVYIQGTTQGTSADIYGTFKIEKAPVGQQTLVISFIGYKKKEIKIQVDAIKEISLSVELEMDAEMLDVIVISDERKTNTENAVLMEIKEAKSVVSGISREQIARSQDKNAAQVMQRIPGINIVDNRFVMIRGVNSRYNSVLINNVVAPSTEVDRRTFSFDLISSGTLDRMLVFKSASPDYPGDFAGGVIKLFTIHDVEEDFFTFKVDMGYRPGTTLQPYFQSEGSATDFLGFDQSFRPLPDNFLSTAALRNENAISEVRKNQALLLSNNFNPTQYTATPDYGFGFNCGKIMNVAGKRLTSFTSVNYSNSYQYFSRDFHRYFAWEDLETPITERFSFVDDTYQKENKVNIMTNWNLVLNARNRIKFSNLFNQIGENETIIRNGYDFIQRPGDELRNYLLGYKSRTIYSGQLEGIHDLDEEQKNQLSWVIGANYLGESEPDLRRFRTFKKEGAENYTMQLPPSSNLFETGRYYGNLGEYTASHGLSFTRDLTNGSANKKNIKIGYYTDYRDRDFSSRYFSYLYPGFNDPTEGERLRNLSLEEIFSPENIKTRNGFILEEGTRPIDSYTANNWLSAAYISSDVSLGKVNVSGGIRAEYNIQQLNARDDFSTIEINNPIFSWLPSINVGYNTSKRTLLRASFGRTVNRPEFRELAPFLFYDYKLEAGRVGNPNLKTAEIDNYDMRFEFYPRIGETISIGGFYKSFINPIEDRTVITTEQPSFTYINADYAYNYGVEIEIRKSLKDLTASSFINKFSVNANASYIVSQVDLGETAVAQDRVRPLQGQAPYIVNAGIYYANNKQKINAGLLYNVFGKSIFSVGDYNFPNIYELERHSVDFTIGKEFNSGLQCKLGIQNILNYAFRFYQDSDRNGNIDENDNAIFTFKRGSLFNMSIQYTFKKKS